MTDTDYPDHLTRDFWDTVRERAERDPVFREALEKEGVEIPPRPDPPVTGAADDRP